jgi:hypothetical protein
MATRLDRIRVSTSGSDRVKRRPEGVTILWSTQNVGHAGNPGGEFMHPTIGDSETHQPTKSCGDFSQRRRAVGLTRIALGASWAGGEKVSRGMPGRRADGVGIDARPLASRERPHLGK